MTEKLPYSGVTSSYLHKWKPEEPNSADTDLGLRKVWFLDAQWSTCPKEVEKEVIGLWKQDDRLGNDVYIIKTSITELLEREVDGVKVAYILQYLREHGVTKEELVVIHWWW